MDTLLMGIIQLFKKLSDFKIFLFLLNYILLIDFYFGIKFHKNIYYLNEFVRSSLDLENDITLRKKDGYISLDELKRWSIINNNSVAFE